MHLVTNVYCPLTTYMYMKYVYTYVCVYMYVCTCVPMCVYLIFLGNPSQRNSTN